jgi:hypothetical protein
MTKMVIERPHSRNSIAATWRYEAAIALANHQARVLWALLSRGASYRPTPHLINPRA